MKGHFDPATAAPIPTDEARISHVIKHLLARSERWDLVTEGLPRDPIAAGAAEGCGPMHLAPGRASFHDLSPRGQAWLLGLHDNHLRPAYLAAVQSATATGRWGWWQDDKRVQAALVGDNGVFVIVTLWGRPAEPTVRTAYRVLPRGVRGEVTQNEFLRAAVRRLNDKTSFGGEATMTMDPTAWLSAARHELDDLLASGGATLTDADAWRALALTARLALAPYDVGLRADPDRALVEAWLGACAPPDPVELSDALGDALAGDDPAEGGVLDALLDIDDHVGVSSLRDDNDSIRLLLDDALATLSLFPERVVPLAGFARMRLATLDPRAGCRGLWTHVEAALVGAAVATQGIRTPLPAAAVAARERLARASRKVVDLATRRLPLPAPIALAAASGTVETRRLGTTTDEINGWVYEQDGDQRIEFVVSDRSRPVQGLVLVGRDGETEHVRVSLPTERDGRGIFASLGPAFGPGNEMRARAARLGLDASRLDWWIEVEDGD